MPCGSGLAGVLLWLVIAGCLHLVFVALVPQAGSPLAGVLGKGDPAVGVEKLAQFLAGVGGDVPLRPREQRPRVDSGGFATAVEHVTPGLGFGGEVGSERTIGPFGPDRCAALPLGVGAVTAAALGEACCLVGVCAGDVQVGDLIVTHGAKVPLACQLGVNVLHVSIRPGVLTPCQHSGTISLMRNTNTTAAAVTRCLRPGCGRKLTAPASIKAGYGPVCRKRIREAARAEALNGFSAVQAAKATELIETAAIVPLNRPGVYRAVSSSGDVIYLTSAHTCNCPAGLNNRSCYHVAAARVLNATRRAA